MKTTDILNILESNFNLDYSIVTIMNVHDKHFINSNGNAGLVINNINFNENYNKVVKYFKIVDNKLITIDKLEAIDHLYSDIFDCLIIGYANVFEIYVNKK